MSSNKRVLIKPSNIVNSRVVNRNSNLQTSKPSTNNRTVNVVKRTTTQPKEETITYTNEQLLGTTFETFKKFYKNNVKQVEIESIINGEVVETVPDNIFVNENPLVELKNIDKQQKYCNKTLYDYQIESIRKLRELELNGFIERVDSEGIKYRVHSNGWLLKLPIGSGKTLVFTFLAMFYNNVPTNPILMSTSGINIPSHDMIKLNNYPFYYENAGYIEKFDEQSQTYIPVENCGVVYENYNQRKLTVIITHHHLMSQMEDYIKSDFKPAFLKTKKIVYANRVTDIKPKDIYGDSCCDILVVSCDSTIMKKLVEYSYEAPFMRVIIDDYTNMIGIDEFRQILASSTILVSGSGFEREKDEIPPSYYTLKHLDYEKYSLVAEPEKTKKGIMRNSIATLELQCANTQFSLYGFTDEVEELALNTYSRLPIQLYKPISERGNISDYLRLSFIMKNLSRLSNAILNVENDIKINKLDPNRIKYFFDWKKQMYEPIEYLGRDRFGKESMKSEVSVITEKLFQPNPVVKQDVPALVHQICSCCGKASEYHFDWGFISSCCGSFFCENCLKCMTTKNIIYTDDDDKIIGKKKDCDNYYCRVCYGKNPIYILNTCRNKNNNLQPYNMIINHFEVDDIINNNGLKFDLYFKMLTEGFVPKYHEGPNVIVKLVEDINKSRLKSNKVKEEVKKEESVEIKVDNDIEEIKDEEEEIKDEVNNVEVDEESIEIKDEDEDVEDEVNVEESVETKDNVEVESVERSDETNSKISTVKLSVDIDKLNIDIQQLFARDRLGILSFNSIEETLSNLKICPSKNTLIPPSIIIYGCPDNIQVRVKNYYNEVFKNNSESPLYRVEIMFIANMSRLIGLHKNILGIIVWEAPSAKDEIKQLIGRIMRVNAWGNPLYFYINCRSINVIEIELKSIPGLELKSSQVLEQTTNQDTTPTSD